MGERFLHLADELRYPKELPEDAVAEVARLKQRMQTERIPRGIPRARHLKLGPGGLTDVEWAAQVLQLRHAGGNPELRTTSTLEALAAEERAGLMSAAGARGAGRGVDPGDPGAQRAHAHHRPGQ